MKILELSNDEIESFKKIGQIKNFDANGILFYENDIADNFYVILSGLVKGGIFENKKEKIFHYFFPNMLVGEISYLEKSNYPLSAMFVTSGEVIVVNKNLLKNSNFSEIQLNQIFQKAMISKVRFLQRSIKTIASVNIKVRCAIFLLEHKNYLQYISMKEMGSVLNTTRESVSRAIGFFIEQKAIKKDKNQIKILDEKFLEKFVKKQENDITF
ncbi:MAG: Crp/Fnr family transcriptional regulator [Halarcobacter sp.]